MWQQGDVTKVHPMNAALLYRLSDCPLSQGRVTVAV